MNSLEELLEELKINYDYDLCSICGKPTDEEYMEEACCNSLKCQRTIYYSLNSWDMR